MGQVLHGCATTTEAVRRAIQHSQESLRHLAGATLDAFSEEPLPPGHPFWSHPQILTAPHVASTSNPATAILGAAEAAENVRRARAGAPLLYEVDRARGY